MPKMKKGISLLLNSLHERGEKELKKESRKKIKSLKKGIIVLPLQSLLKRGVED
jgi:hypothetical protein